MTLDKSLNLFGLYQWKKKKKKKKPRKDTDIFLAYKEEAKPYALLRSLKLIALMTPESWHKYGSREVT